MMTDGGVGLPKKKEKGFSNKTVWWKKSTEMISYLVLLTKFLKFNVIHNTVRKIKHYLNNLSMSSVTDKMPMECKVQSHTVITKLATVDPSWMKSVRQSGRGDE